MTTNCGGKLIEQGARMSDHLAHSPAELEPPPDYPQPDMQTTRNAPAHAGTDGTASATAGRVSGERAIIEFSPGLINLERLCAGVVIRTKDGQIDYRSAIDAERASHAFGAAGEALASIARHLCASLAEAWNNGKAADWVPPFQGAQIARRTPFSAQTVAAAMETALRQHSTLHTLLECVTAGGEDD